jgi:hypothetical protein
LQLLGAALAAGMADSQQKPLLIICGFLEVFADALLCSFWVLPWLRAWQTHSKKTF